MAEFDFGDKVIDTELDIFGPQPKSYAAKNKLVYTKTSKENTH